MHPLPSRGLRHRAGPDHPFGEEGIIERPNTWTGSPFTLLVDPGNVDNSFILRKVSETELDGELEGGPMPLQIEPLTDDELATVRQWVEDGAEPDGPFNPVGVIFGTDNTSLGDAAGKCTFCHPGPMTRMDVIDPFDPVNGMVNVEATLEGTRVSRATRTTACSIQKLEGAEDLGEQMPFNPERMTPDEIADLTAWIEAGAPNN